MINIPKPEPGSKIQPGWFLKLWNTLNGFEITGDGKTIRVQRLGWKFSISAVRRPSSAAGGGDSYNGYFALSYTGNVITVGAGMLKAGNSFVVVATGDVTATAAGYVICTITYSAGYTGALSFVTDLTSLANGNDVIIIATVEWDSAVTAVNRQLYGPALVTGKSV